MSPSGGTGYLIGSGSSRYTRGSLVRRRSEGGEDVGSYLSDIGESNFGIYPEAYYGPNLDIYNGEILGVEVDGKGAFSGLKAAFGPQLWWGANPAVLLKYQKNCKFQTQPNEIFSIG